MVCYSCGQPKNELTPKKSALLSGINLLMCKKCLEMKYEPRWIIIISARQQGASHVRDFIVKRRYLGKEITANELIT